MKTYISFLALLFFLNELNFSQIQVKPDWPSLADTPWPITVGDMQATGRSEFVGPRTGNIIWRKDMPLGILYGPVIGYDDILYAGERALSPDSVNYFYALDKNGNNLWTFETESFYPNNVAPVIGKDSTIYFGGGNNNIFALHPNGDLKWQLKRIIYGNAKFIPIAKNGDLYIPTIDTLYIVSSKGDIKIKKYIPEINNFEIVFSTGGDTIYFFTGGSQGEPGSLKAADINGNILWSYDFKSHNEGIPVVDNKNRIYVFGQDSGDVFGGHLYCFNSNGSINWKYEVFGYNNWSSPSIDLNGNIIFPGIYADTVSLIMAITSLNQSGEVNWITQLTLEEDYFDNVVDHGLVTDAEGKIYFGTTEGTYFGCMDSTGNILWTIDLEGNEFDGSPVIGADGTLYIGTHISSLFTNHTRNLIAVKDKTVSVSDEFVISDFMLYQNYPNPFNPVTNIKFSIPSAGYVKLHVFDILGREVKTLVNEYKSAGDYEVEFNAEDFSSGIYFYEMRTQEYTKTRKMILLE